jgi:hypothetical protein
MMRNIQLFNPLLIVAFILTSCVISFAQRTGGGGDKIPTSEINEKTPTVISLSEMLVSVKEISKQEYKYSPKSNTKRRLRLKAETSLKKNSKLDK